MSTTVPSGINPVPFEMNFTCQKPTIAAPAGAACWLRLLCALAVACVAFNGAERSRSAVAVLDVIGPSDAPHCALVFTAKTVATINIPYVTAMARIMFLIGLSPFGRHGSQGLHLQTLN